MVPEGVAAPLRAAWTIRPREKFLLARGDVAIAEGDDPGARGRRPQQPRELGEARRALRGRRALRREMKNKDEERTTVREPELRLQDPAVARVIRDGVQPRGPAQGKAAQDRDVDTAGIGPLDQDRRPVTRGRELARAPAFEQGAVLDLGQREQIGTASRRLEDDPREGVQLAPQLRRGPIELAALPPVVELRLPRAPPPRVRLVGPRLVGVVALARGDRIEEVLDVPEGEMPFAGRPRRAPVVAKHPERRPRLTIVMENRKQKEPGRHADTRADEDRAAGLCLVVRIECWNGIEMGRNLAPGKPPLPENRSPQSTDPGPPWKTKPHEDAGLATSGPAPARTGTAPGRDRGPKAGPYSPN